MLGHFYEILPSAPKRGDKCDLPLYLMLLAWMRLISERNASRFWYLCLEMFCWNSEVGGVLVKLLLNAGKYKSMKCVNNTS